MSRKCSLFEYLVRVTGCLLFAFLIFTCSKDDAPPPVEGEEEQPTVPTSSGDLPLMVISTPNNTIVDEPKVNGEMTVIKRGELLFEGNIGIEIRGASSQFFDKKSYGLETRDASNQDLDVSLLGFPEEEDWVLHGPYSDKSLVRNHLIYGLARDMGRYASRSELVELNLNGTYRGVYAFMEKLKRDKNRIAVSKLTSDEVSGEDLTGGYVLKIDKLSRSDNGQSYTSANSFESRIVPPSAGMGQAINFVYEYPEAEDIVPEQQQYIIDYVSQFEAALASDTFTDPQTGYANYIDVDSFIDFFILTELSNNVDGYRLSTYIQKDKNEKLAMGPIWDFNLAFGNADYCSGGETNVWAYKFNERCPLDIWLVPFWWERLLQDPAFTERLKQRWATLRGSTLSNGTILGKVDGYIGLMQEAGAIDKNFGTWDVLGIYVWPNNFVGQTYNDEIVYLKDWITNRLEWLDGAMNEL
ncbi:hypothetical protein FK220_002275 [Flavobacteriaceae bacterium TP-CH-4]|uniref:CotH protein n=1 Tax=Pelagihabitans pacificus TaxID=2696054 RepID=A0A967AS15_9FLAO|nr:CotH kinase family protein [Pelagihabitans pacificus]NHF58150.1 hypothetical protein [Pelagihabitans pacificus]